MAAQNYKLNVPITMKVLALMARGEKHGTILGMLRKDHNIEYSSQSLSLLRKKHKETVLSMQGLIIDAEATEAEKIRIRTLHRINRRLDQADVDEGELEKLNEDYRSEDSEMTLSEYRRRKMGLVNLSVAELVTLAKEMHVQSVQAKGRKASGAPQLPSGDGTVQEEQITTLPEALMTAIKNGDTIQLQQMVIN